MGVIQVAVKLFDMDACKGVYKEKSEALIKGYYHVKTNQFSIFCTDEKRKS